MALVDVHGKAGCAEDPQAPSRGEPVNDRVVLDRLEALQSATVELAMCDDEDRLYRRAIELAVGRLGFDRFSIWVGSEDGDVLAGTYGTDESGAVRRETDSRIPVSLDVVRRRLDAEGPWWVRDSGVPLGNQAGQAVGLGDLVRVGLWDGRRVVGCVYADNLLTGAPIDDEQCDLMALYATAIGHLRAKLRAEAASRATEEQFRRLFDEMPSGFAIIEFVRDAAGTPVDMVCVDANPALCAMLGLPRAGLVGRAATALGTNLREDWLGALHEVAATGVALRTDDYSPTLGIHLGIYAFRSPSCQVALILSDITERIRVERAILESESQLRALFSSAGAGIFQMSVDNKYLRVNQRWAEMLGYTAEELLALDPRVVTHPDDIARTGEAAGSLVEGRVGDYRMVKRYARKDGSVMWGEVSVSPIRDREGHVDSVIAVVIDVTERRWAEEERRELEARVQSAQRWESLAVLAGGVAHDFNNILQGILGNVGLALMQTPPSSPSYQYLTRLEEAAARAGDLANQMLAYSGRGRLEVRLLSLSRLVEGMLGLLQSSTPKGIRLALELARELPTVEGDETQLSQVVLNLVTNGAEAVGNGPGTVTLRTGAMDPADLGLDAVSVDADPPEGPCVYVEVEDTGCGMDTATRARMFEPFYTTKFTGRGLGLAAVLGIVKGHSGAIAVDSVPGRGTRIRVLLPIAHADPTEAPAAPTWAVAASRPARGGTVLVVDDEPYVLDVARLTLEQAGYTALTSDDREGAVELARANADRLRALVIDVTMPGPMSVDQVCETVHELCPDATLVLSSGYSEEDVTSRLRSSEIAAFLHKPYRPQQLIGVIEHASR